MNDKKYDYLIIGSGLFASTFAYLAKTRGKKCLIVEKRNHIGGNIYTKEVEGINVHEYGAHIFHTSEKAIWDFVNQFSEFNRYTNSPIAFYKNEVYNMPFNMNTFSKMWNVKTPAEAMEIIHKQKEEYGTDNPKNLEEQALSLVGHDIYEKLVKGYTEKQWGKKATELPPFIIKRLPVRFTYDNNYFNDLYQGIPVGGYTRMIENMVDGIKVILNKDYLKCKEEYKGIANKIVFTGMIDEYFDYCYGELEYRSLNFETEVLDMKNFQGNSVINYTEYEVPYTRIIEHKHFEFGDQEKTVVTKEYPALWKRGDEPFYPINDEKNNRLYKKYKMLANKEKDIIFGGRLAQYKYFDMHNVIAEAIKCAENEFGEGK